MTRHQADGLFVVVGILGVAAFMAIMGYSGYQRKVRESYVKQIQAQYAKVEILDISEDKGACPHHKDEKVVFDALSKTGERICGQACCHRGFDVCVITPNETCSW